MDFAHLTLPHIVAKRAEQQPSRIGINYTEDGLTDTIERTYFDIAARARAVALRLIEQGLEPGSRALLIYPPGLDFLDGFLGCLFACVIPVPVYPPRRHGESERFVKLMQSADPSVVLTIGVTHARYKKAALGTDNLPWIETDSATPSMDIFPPREARFDDIALLQYTSGSTGSPKGVQITHANLTSNAIGIKNCFELDESSWCCGWLPLYHDMGLIGNLLEPLFCGFPTTLMAPLNFIQQPMRWLRAISRTRASIAGGPSFGYDLCLRRVSEGERAELDLSCWKVAYNGSERINMSVLERFAAFFEVCGFERTTFLPCYGLAEATLMVTGIERNQPPTSLDLDLAALGEGRALTSTSAVGSIPIANCGKPCGNAEVKIVAPNSILELKNREIGEIWVSGPAVSKGYWKDPETTEKTWVSWLDRKWLNTGDLGFIHEGELYVTGRTKEILIINGVNYYPQDIEDELERQLDFVAPNGVAAFPAPVDGVEQLGLVIEIAKEASRLENSETSDGAQISPEYYRHAVVRLLKRHFDVPLGQFCCVLAGGILRTTSGKKRRNETRIALLAGDLPMWQPVTMEQRP